MADEEKKHIERILNPTRFDSMKVVFAVSADDVVEKLRTLNLKAVLPGFDYTPAEHKMLITLRDRYNGKGVAFSREILEDVETAIKNDPSLSRAWNAARALGNDVEPADRASTSLGAVLKSALAQNDKMLGEGNKSRPVKKEQAFSVAA
jgi:hypothetical protein